jgi:type II secretory pathway component HofQ
MEHTVTNNIQLIYINKNLNSHISGGTNSTTTYNIQIIHYVKDTKTVGRPSITLGYS